jgi:hypothetical protein
MVVEGIQDDPLTLGEPKVCLTWWVPFWAGVHWTFMAILWEPIRPVGAGSTVSCAFYDLQKGVLMFNDAFWHHHAFLWLRRREGVSIYIAEIPGDMVPIEQLSNEQLEEYGRECKKSTKRLFVSCYHKTEQGVVQIKEWSSTINIFTKMQASGT